MKLRERYKHLNFWNRIGFWGSIASITGFVWSFSPFFLGSHGEPILEIVFKSPTSIFVNNIGTGTAEDIQFYPAVFSINKEGRIHDRFIPSPSTWHIRELTPGKDIEIPRSAYIRIKDFSELAYPQTGYQGPFLATVITYKGPTTKHLAQEVFQFYGSEESLLLAIPLSYATGVNIRGNFEILDQILKAIKIDIILAFRK